MTYNPFIHGNPVTPANFFDRRQALRRVAGRLVSGGQSTAIIGEPRMGKTSLLKYLAAQEKQVDLYGATEMRMLFSFIDTQALGSQFTPAQFWEQALMPIKQQYVNSNPDSSLTQQYHLCCDNHFGTFTLENLFRLLKEEGRRLVLLIDEFDLLLYHSVLNSAEFFGGLRSLASRSEGALALVVGSRLPLSQLNTRTQQFNPTGSPYFNIFQEITLGPFPEKDILALLDRAGDHFTLWDRRAIRAVAGGHPFLLQTAAAAMWEACEDGLTEMVVRRQYMISHLYQENEFLFTDTWRVWAPSTRKAFTTVALAHTANLLPEREFLLQVFVESIRDFGPELSDLQECGLITRDEQLPGGWRVVPQAMLWWLADELVRAVRTDVPFEHWLQAQELDNLLTRQERDQLSQVMRGAVQGLGHGATTLVEAFAKGLGEKLVGGE